MALVSEATLHRAGPVEDDPTLLSVALTATGTRKLGTVVATGRVQRCLRCDAVLRELRPDDETTEPYPVGCRVSTADACPGGIS